MENVHMDVDRTNERTNDRPNERLCLLMLLFLFNSPAAAAATAACMLCHTPSLIQFMFGVASHSISENIYARTETFSHILSHTTIKTKIIVNNIALCYIHDTVVVHSIN